ncbi:glutathione S-transferase [Brumicola pallidula]|uniref:Glutathione S-transferase domain-containing protein n=1 Tax=Brumicola pallidula DSM 14239 = ACAM 615 TaxID=1121922 RepID=K7A251_9ALTE|nr:glutathione S-transferase [Glaciecola pallidula]GAC29600.1 glutathione S-transferase domain-containing protein [Glaciecola pallidula DSM 14239 = ACAM 615]
MTLPILYSLRHCPFAMRARLAIFKSQQAVELRDVKLTNKPAAMLIASAKGTVPILVVSRKQVIDESLDVMLWSLGKSDPANLLLESAGKLPDLLAFIAVYDREFKPCIERYKAAKRYHEPNLVECRQACEAYIQDLEQRLSEHDYIFGEHESIADIAIFPFIRQFAKVERQWYVQSSYLNLKRWLNRYLQSGMFNKVMTPYPIWQEGNEIVVFCGE